MKAFLLVAIVVALLLFLILDLGERAVEPSPATVKTAQQWGTERPPYVIAADMFITTTTARPRSAPTHRTTMRAMSVGAAFPAGHALGFINGFPCGGLDLPRCSTIWRESKGIPTAYNPTGCGGRSCGGIAQFDPVTFIPGCTVSKWNNHQCGTYMGFQYAHLAPVDVQYFRIREVYAHGEGCAHWGPSECVGIR